MRKLGSTDEKTVLFRVKMPESMKAWLDDQAGGASRLIRELIATAMRRQTKVNASTKTKENRT